MQEVTVFQKNKSNSDDSIGDIVTLAEEQEPIFYLTKNINILKFLSGMLFLNESFRKMHIVYPSLPINKNMPPIRQFSDCMLTHSQIYY